MKRLYTCLSLTLFLAGFYGCAGSVKGHIESAKFHLDQSNYTQAIAEASQALSDDPDNAEAARILASAYFGRSGMDFLDLAEAIVDLSDSDQSNFQVIAEALPDEVDLDDLRSAIVTIEGLDGIDEENIIDEVLADAVFDLAMMQIIEQFALGVYGSDYFTDFDVTQILEAESDTAQADLVTFDNYLIASGVDEDEDFIAEIRQTFCILEPISAGEGFTLAEYQALVACELSDDPDSFDTTALSADIANCGALHPDNQGALVQACFEADTAL